MSAEEWREIPGFPDYMASNLGRVRSHKGDPEGKLMAVTANSQNRYLYTGPSRDGRQVVTPVHVLVALAFHGMRPEGMEVRHLDGSRTNNRADNLAWGTHAENMRDTVRHGTHGSRHLAARAHCKNGHPFIDGNTRVVTVNGGQVRRCRVCDATSKIGSAQRELAAAMAAISAVSA